MMPASETRVDSTGPWNSLEATKLCISVSLPLVILYMGWHFTALGNATQMETQRAASVATYERQRKDSLELKDLDITKTYLQYSMLRSPCTLQPQVAMLLTQATVDHSKKLFEHFLTLCPAAREQAGADGGSALSAVVAQSAKNAASSYITELEGSGRGNARIELRNIYQQNPELVGALLAKAIKANSNNYQITLGALVVLGTVNAGWRRTGELAVQFEALRRSPNMGDPVFAQWFQAAEKKAVK